MLYVEPEILYKGLPIVKIRNRLREQFLEISLKWLSKSNLDNPPPTPHGDTRQICLENYLRSIINLSCKGRIRKDDEGVISRRREGREDHNPNPQTADSTETTSQ